jgi:hypothetical protein
MAIKIIPNLDQIACRVDRFHPVFRNQFYGILQTRSDQSTMKTNAVVVMAAANRPDVLRINKKSRLKILTRHGIKFRWALSAKMSLFFIIYNQLFKRFVKGCRIWNCTFYFEDSGGKQGSPL